MQREYRLRKRKDFRRAFRAGKSVANRQFVVYTYRRPESDVETVRIGVSVSRKIGKAVVRNRVKRLVKEITRTWITQIDPQTDIIIIARNPVVTLNFQEMRSSLRHVFRRARLFSEKASRLS